MISRIFAKSLRCHRFYAPVVKNEIRHKEDLTESSDCADDI